LRSLNASSLCFSSGGACFADSLGARIPASGSGGGLSLAFWHPLQKFYFYCISVPIRILHTNYENDSAAYDGSHWRVKDTKIN
jgi:hypothetical protein